jgi:hypothetical protein
LKDDLTPPCYGISIPLTNPIGGLVPGAEELGREMMNDHLGLRLSFHTSSPVSNHINDACAGEGGGVLVIVVSDIALVKGNAKDTILR